MSRRGHQKIIRRVLDNQLKASNEGYKYILTKLELREWFIFGRHCEKISQPIIDEIIKEEKERNETLKT